MHPVICSALWIAPAVLASSCSLLFDEKRGGSGPCSDSFDETLSFYPVDDDMLELLDVHGRANGQPHLGQDLSTTGIRKTAGPCGNALSFEASSTSDRWFVEIDSSDHQVVPLSVDVWINLAPEVMAKMPES